MTKLINWIWSLIMALFGKKDLTEEPVLSIEMKTSLPSTTNPAKVRRKRNKRFRQARRDMRRAARGLSRMGS